MKIFQIALKGLIWLMFIMLISVIYGSLINFGIKETVNPIVEYIAFAILCWIPGSILAIKIMKYVKIEDKPKTDEPIIQEQTLQEGFEVLAGQCKHENSVAYLSQANCAICCKCGTRFT